ncbi:hypothetical protein PTKIN_Ptkin01aG0145100 [Pterospermum kingtungense]
MRKEGLGVMTRTKVSGGGGGAKAMAVVLRRSKLKETVKMAALEYCLSGNVIGFVYAGFQAYDLAYYLITKTHVIHHYLRQPFDFFMDHVLTYLLILASSTAATRVDNWQSNLGKNEFTETASASVAMAFLAFIAFAFSSLISEYELCTHESE